MADIDFWIERDGFDPILLDSDGGRPYGLQKGTTGFGVGPVEQNYRVGAADGGTLAGERVAMRPMDVGLMVFGADRIETGNHLRALANILRARRGQPLPRLVAYFATGEVFETPVSYVSGLELDYSNALADHVSVTLSLMSDPFWTARDSVSFTIGNTGAPVGLLPDLAELPVASSYAIGEVSVTNPGDYECPVSFRITGPGGPTQVVVNGVGFTVEHELESGEFLLVDGERKTLTDNSGDSHYDYFSAAPKFPMLPPGTSKVFVSMPSAEPGVSSVTGYFRPRRELVF